MAAPAPSTTTTAARVIGEISAPVPIMGDRTITVAPTAMTSRTRSGLIDQHRAGGGEEAVQHGQQGAGAHVLDQVLDPWLPVGRPDHGQACADGHGHEGQQHHRLQLPPGSARVLLGHPCRQEALRGLRAAVHPPGREGDRPRVQQRHRQHGDAEHHRRDDHGHDHLTAADHQHGSPAEEGGEHHQDREDHTPRPHGGDIATGPHGQRRDAHPAQSGRRGGTGRAQQRGDAQSDRPPGQHQGGGPDPHTVHMQPAQGRDQRRVDAQAASSPIAAWRSASRSTRACSVALLPPACAARTAAHRAAARTAWPQRLRAARAADREGTAPQR